MKTETYNEIGDIISEVNTYANSIELNYERLAIYKEYKAEDKVLEIKNKITKDIENLNKTTTHLKTILNKI